MGKQNSIQVPMKYWFLKKLVPLIKVIDFGPLLKNKTIKAIPSIRSIAFSIPSIFHSLPLNSLHSILSIHFPFHFKFKIGRYSQDRRRATYILYTQYFRPACFFPLLTAKNSDSITKSVSKNEQEQVCIRPSGGGLLGTGGTASGPPRRSQLH